LWFWPTEVETGFPPIGVAWKKNKSAGLIILQPMMKIMWEKKQVPG